MLFAGRIVKNEPVYRGKRGVDWENGGTWANVEKTANRVRKAFFSRAKREMCWELCDLYNQGDDLPR